MSKDRMSEDRVKNVQKCIGVSKKQAEGVVIAQDRIQQNMDSAQYYQDKKDAEKEEIKEKGAENYDSQTWLEHRTPDADRALLEAIKMGKVGAFELFYKLMDRLKDKTETEIRIGLTADEVSRRNIEAERGLRESGFGMEKVPDEPALLSQDIRQNQGQQEGDNPS